MKEKLAWSLLFAIGGCIVLVAAYKLHSLNASTPAAAAAFQSAEASGIAEEPSPASSGGQRRRDRPFVSNFRETPPPRPRPAEDEAPAAFPETTAPEPEPAATATPVPTTTVALAALTQVGANEQATRIWLAAINDASRSAEERQSLILGLSVLGFADASDLTEDEQALVVARMALIQAVAPETLDDANRTAFQTAYAALQAMQSQLAGQ